jgi:pimeloyl-ACP methyl ester carboxylesterase
MEDRLQYDLLEIAPTLDMPVLMMVWDKDTSTPLEHQQLLFEKIPAWNKQLEIFNGPHYDFNDEQLSKIYKIVDNWIKKVNQK